MASVGTFRAYMAAICFLASTSLLPASAVAANHPFDGSWSLLFVTHAGSCDPSYNFAVNIVHGRISHPNLVRFRGSVSRKGAARASVGVGDKFASGGGRLTRTSGGGSWTGYSGASRCSGRWTAQRN